jgi:hypothetical protein
MRSSSLNSGVANSTVRCSSWAEAAGAEPEGVGAGVGERDVADVLAVDSPKPVDLPELVVAVVANEVG